MIERRFRGLWEQLQGKKPHLPHFLAEIHLEGIRGIDDVRIKFDYPVSVIAGGNASGKSTVLFAAACAYRVPGAGVKDFVPSTLFPDYRPRVGVREDPRQVVVIEFDYSAPRGWRPGPGQHKVPNVTARELESIGLSKVASSTVERVKSLDVHECLYKTLDVPGRFIRTLPFYSISKIST